jgi:hypothetical protein
MGLISMELVCSAVGTRWKSGLDGLKADEEKRGGGKLSLWTGMFKAASASHRGADWSEDERVGVVKGGVDEYSGCMAACSRGAGAAAFCSVALRE